MAVEHVDVIGILVVTNWAFSGTISSQPKCHSCTFFLSLMFWQKVLHNICRQSCSRRFDKRPGYRIVGLKESIQSD